MPQLELANLSNLDIPLSALQRTRVYEQSFEDGTSDLTEDNCTQTVQDEEVFAGKYALKVTIPAGETGYVETPTRPVSPGQLITFTIVHKEDENIADLKLQIVWRRSSGGIISIDEFTLDLTSEWTTVSRTISAPGNAVSMAIRISGTASDTADGNIFLDDIVMDLIGLVIRVDNKGRPMINIDDYLEPILVFSSQYQLSTTPLETEVLDLKGLKRRLFFFINAHDKPVYIDVLTSYSPSAEFISIRGTPIEIPANSIKPGIMNTDAYTYIKMRAWASESPSTGYFAVVVLGYYL